MTALTVQVVAADEDGFITFADGSSHWSGEDITTITTSAKVKVGQWTDMGEIGSGEGLEYEAMTFTGWVHLKNFTIAQGATIDNAKLHFYHNANAGFEDFNSFLYDPGEGMTVAAEDVDSASKPTSYADVNGMTLTSASVATGSFIDSNDDDMDYSPDETFNDAWYPTHGTPGAGLEIKTVLQELVNRGGWSSGSNINLKLTPADHDGNTDWHILWTDYDTSTSLAIKLVIDYTAAAVSTPTSEAFLLFLD
jgi:hypothetical protein